MTQQYFYFMKDLSIKGHKLNEKANSAFFKMQREELQKKQQGIEEANRIKKNQQQREALKKYILGGAK